jgi:hypothetical protein
VRLAARGHDVWAFGRRRLRPGADGAAPPDGYVRSDGAETYRGVRLAFRPSLNAKHTDAASHTLLCALESACLHHFDIVHLHGIGPAAFAPALFGRRVVSTHALDWRQVGRGPRPGDAPSRGGWGEAQRR